MFFAEDYYKSIRLFLHDDLNVPVYSENTFSDLDAAFPCIVLARDNSNTDRTYSGPDWIIDFLTFSCKAYTIQDAERMRNRIIEALDGYTIGMVIALEDT